MKSPISSSQPTSSLQSTQANSQLHIQSHKKPIKPEDPTLSSQYNYPSRFISAYGAKLQTPMTFEGTGRTKQSFREECDINHILAKFQRTGLLDFTNKNEARYADVTGLDYEVGMQAVTQAQSMFNDLPSSVRARFKNDPREFLDFVQDEDNHAECVKLGLLKAQDKPVDPKAAATTPALRDAAPATRASPKGKPGALEQAPETPPKGGVDQSTT